jgi:hypothetical protein
MAGRSLDLDGRIALDGGDAERCVGLERSLANHTGQDVTKGALFSLTKRLSSAWQSMNTA